MQTINHKKLLSLIGEIDGITLRSIDEYTVAVIMSVNGREIELIRDSGTFMDHHITRIGIAGCLERKGNI